MTFDQLTRDDLRYLLQVDKSSHIREFKRIWSLATKIGTTADALVAALTDPNSALFNELYPGWAADVVEGEESLWIQQNQKWVTTNKLLDVISVPVLETLDKNVLNGTNEEYLSRKELIKQSLAAKKESDAKEEETRKKKLATQEKNAATRKRAWLAKLKQTPEDYREVLKLMKSRSIYDYLNLRDPTFEDICAVIGYPKRTTNRLLKEYSAVLETAKKLQDQQAAAEFTLSLMELKDAPLFEVLLFTNRNGQRGERFIKNFGVTDPTDIPVKGLGAVLRMLKRKIPEKDKKALVERWHRYTNAVKSCNGYSFVHSANVCELLGITKTEYDRWKGDKLPIAKKEPFHKWGRIMEVPYYCPKVLSGISPDDIKKWRLEHVLSSKTGSPVILPATTLSRWESLLETARTFEAYYNKKWFTLLDVEIKGVTFPIRKDLRITLSPLTVTENSEADLRKAVQSIQSNLAKTSLMAKLEAFELTTEEEGPFLEKAAEAYKSFVRESITASTFDDIAGKLLYDKLQAQLSTKAKELLQVARYEQSFPLARSLNRKIKLVYGPTNSGKTHEAINALLCAESGVYLAPLRLLALEIYQKLSEQGIACNLITGEERIITPGARHSCRTVEMLSPDEAVEVAVIDECQMLYDGQRGWAWTAAIVGVPAKTVYALGSVESRTALRNMFQHLKEEVEEQETERKTPLVALDKAVKLENLEKGDCIVAFSRVDVLAYATLLRRRKHKVSVIYGALSPEIRRTQANAFARGTTDILVATDAIGMGLNLPIRRVLFAVLEKFDGESTRELYDSEFLQIAGRAGRYGIHEKGWVGVLQNEVCGQKEAHHVVKKLAKKLVANPRLRLSVAPAPSQLSQLSKLLDDDNLSHVLAYYSNMSLDSTVYTHADLSQQVALYEELGPALLRKFPLEVQYRLTCAPINADDSALVAVYKHALKQIVAGDFVDYEVSAYACVKRAYDELAALEGYGKWLAAYIWLSFTGSFGPGYRAAEALLDWKGATMERNDLSSHIATRLSQVKVDRFSKQLSPYKQDMSALDEFW